MYNKLLDNKLCVTHSLTFTFLLSTQPWLYTICNFVLHVGGNLFLICYVKTHSDLLRKDSF
jgi:hypothetical protein